MAAKDLLETLIGKMIFIDIKILLKMPLYPANNNMISNVANGHWWKCFSENELELSTFIKIIEEKEKEYRASGLKKGSFLPVGGQHLCIPKTKSELLGKIQPGLAELHAEHRRSKVQGGKDYKLAVREGIRNNFWTTKIAIYKFQIPAFKTTLNDGKLQMPKQQVVDQAARGKNHNWQDKVTMPNGYVPYLFEFINILPKIR